MSKSRRHPAAAARRAATVCAGLFLLLAAIGVVLLLLGRMRLDVDLDGIGAINPYVAMALLPAVSFVVVFGFVYVIAAAAALIFPRRRAHRD